METKSLLEFLDGDRPVSIYRCFSPIGCIELYRVEDDSTDPRVFVFYNRHEAMTFAREYQQRCAPQTDANFYL